MVMLIILNNKSNLVKEEFCSYLKQLENLVSKHSLVLCPSSIYFEKVNSSRLLLGSQNVSSYDMGAYTGEISAKQLKSLGVSYAIVGHSERRIYQHENNEEINRKIKKLLENNIVPILCIGETKEEKEQSLTIDKITTELEECLRGISNIEDVILAYEPIWAIGTGNTPSCEDIEKVLGFMKKNYPNNKLIYGGSVNERNIDEFKHSRLIDGFLLGGLSLSVEKLNTLLQKLEEV